jgi:transcriptional regulator with XRE-family HTH domain
LKYFRDFAIFQDKMGTNMRDRLRELRAARGLNQNEFAQRLGLTQTALSMIETGKSAFTAKNIKLVCAAFGANETWLRTGKGKMFNRVSPYEKEFVEIIRELPPETQEALLRIARQLLETQKKAGKRAIHEIH